MKPFAESHGKGSGHLYDARELVSDYTPLYSGVALQLTRIWLMRLFSGLPFARVTSSSGGRAPFISAGSGYLALLRLRS